MYDADTQMICTIHTNVPEKYGCMYGTDKTGHRTFLFLINTRTGKRSMRKKESKNQKANNKTVSCDAEHNRESLLQLFK
jgi:hypothetical protein